MIGERVIMMLMVVLVRAANIDTNCPLSGQSLYGWQVRIWDRTIKTTVAHGSIISYLAVVAGCSTFNSGSGTPLFPREAPERYGVIGQRVQHMQEFEKLEEWCTQTRQVKQIIPHPKCLMEGPVNRLTEPTKRAFDFSIFLLTEPFSVGNSYTYPTMTLPATASRMIMDVAFINVEETPACEMPVYKQRDEQLPRSQTNALVQSIPFHWLCVERYCNDTDFDTEASCYEFLSLRAKATQLCMYPTWTDSFPKPNDGLNWYVGTPFCCNGTSYGQAGYLKTTSVVPKFAQPGDDEFVDVVHDFFYVPTYLRVWPWIHGAILRFGASWMRPFFFDDPSPTPPAPPQKAGVPDQILPRRPPRVQLTFPPDKQKIWYRSAGSSSMPPFAFFFFVSIFQMRICGFSL